MLGDGVGTPLTPPPPLAVQEVEYVKQEAKVLYLLTCLQKTAPPVLIFAENKKDVDDIHEYLLLKGVAAVSVHGGKSQVGRWAREPGVGSSCAAAPSLALNLLPIAGGAQRSHSRLQGRN